MPCLISCHLVGNCWAGAHQRHISYENIQELREFVQARSPQNLPHVRDSTIVSEFVDAFSVPARSDTFRLPGDQFRNIFLVGAGIIVNVHRPELKECEAPTILSDPFLFEEYWAF